MVARGRFELPTPALWVLCSNQLSYLATKWVTAEDIEYSAICQELYVYYRLKRRIITALYIKAEVHDVAIFDDVLFTFYA